MSVRSSFKMTVGFVGASVAVFAPALASAHVGFTGSAPADGTQVLPFVIGHGCEGADTTKLEVAIPASVTSVRALPSAFGPVEIRKNDAGDVTAVIWTNAAPRQADEMLYELAIRAKLPNEPFTNVYFPTKQTCKDKDGNEIVVEWKATAEEIAAAGDSAELEPAPVIPLVPAHSPGWNKITVKTKIADLSIFDDAQIVWAGDAAYSSNATTQEQIKNEDGVTELKEIAANTDIWVKY